MWARCEELYNKKLWHQVQISFEANIRHSFKIDHMLTLDLFQLTIQLGVLVKEPSMQTKLISIYTDFIADFEAKLDPLKLSQIGMVVVDKFTSPEEAIAFVERIQDKVKMHNEALCLCKVRKHAMALVG